MRWECIKKSVSTVVQEENKGQPDLEFKSIWQCRDILVDNTLVMARFGK